MRPLVAVITISSVGYHLHHRMREHRRVVGLPFEDTRPLSSVCRSWCRLTPAAIPLVRRLGVTLLQQGLSTPEDSWTHPCALSACRHLFSAYTGGETLAELSSRLPQLTQNGRFQLMLNTSREGGLLTEADLIENQYRIEAELHFGKRHPHAVSHVAIKLPDIIDRDTLINWDENNTFDDVYADPGGQRLLSLIQTAKACSVPLMIDAEEQAIQRGIQAIVQTVWPYANTQHPILQTTFQYSLKSGEASATAFQAFCHQTQTPARYKMVRGAYLSHDWHASWPTKSLTDAAYNRGLTTAPIGTIIATHNITSLWCASQYFPGRFYHATLQGMGEFIPPLPGLLGEIKYVPFGPTKELAPFFLRRAEEAGGPHGYGCDQLVYDERRLWGLFNQAIRHILCTIRYT